MSRKFKVLVIVVFVLLLSAGWDSLSGSAGLVHAMDNRVSVYIHDNGATSFHVAEGSTVGRFLDAVGIQLGPYDIVTPALDHQFGNTVEHHIEITRGFTVMVNSSYGMEAIEVPSGMRVGFLLKRLSDERGVEYVYEGSLNEELQPGQVVQLDSAQTEHVMEYELLPFDTEQVMTDTILEGQLEIIRDGREGLREMVYSVVSVNGTEQSRVLISDTVTAQPESRLIHIGTGRLSLAEQQPEPATQFDYGQPYEENWQSSGLYPAEPIEDPLVEIAENTEYNAEYVEGVDSALAIDGVENSEDVEYIEIFSSLDAPEVEVDYQEQAVEAIIEEVAEEEEVYDPDAPPKQYISKMAMRATAYTADYASTGKNPGHPQFGVTASGMKVRYGVVAVDPNVIPLGTNLYIYGYGYCIAADTGSAIKGNRVDLYFNTSEECYRFGHREVEVYVLG